MVSVLVTILIGSRTKTLMRRPTDTFRSVPGPAIYIVAEIQRSMSNVKPDPERSIFISYQAFRSRALRPSEKEARLYICSIAGGLRGIINQDVSTLYDEIDATYRGFNTVVSTVAAG